MQHTAGISNAEKLRVDWKKRWPNFRPEEVLSMDGLTFLEYGYLPIQMSLLDKLEKLREVIGKPIIVNSGVNTHRGYRSISENSKLEGAATHSWHCKGCAADVSIAGMTPFEVGEVATKLGFTGVGIYDTFTHIDIRLGEYVTWDFRGKN